MRTQLGRFLLVAVGGVVLTLGSFSAPATAADDDTSPSPAVSTDPSPPPSASPSPSPSHAGPAPTDPPPVESGPGGAPDHEGKEQPSGRERRARRASVAVEVVDDAFQPSQITVDVGDEVTWTSSGDHTHTVTADDGSFGSGDLANGESFSTTFDEGGSFAYYCKFHGGPDGVGMSGVVVVRATDASGGDTTTGGATDLPPTGRSLLPVVIAGAALALVGTALLVRSRRLAAAGER